MSAGPSQEEGLRPLLYFFRSMKPPIPTDRKIQTRARPDPAVGLENPGQPADLGAMRRRHFTESMWLLSGALRFANAVQGPGAEPANPH